MNLKPGRISAATFVAVALCGCASVKEGVVGSTRADISPFAAETVNTLSIDSVEIRRNALKRLREYFDDDTVEVRDLRDEIHNIDQFRKGVALYSLELVRIAGLNESPAGKSRLLAEYLETSLGDRLVEYLDMRPEEFAAIVENVRQQAKFLDAIKSVQPLIALASNHHETLLRQIENDHLPAVINLLDDAIEADFAVVLQQEDAMEVRRDELMIALQLLDRAMAGDSSVMPALQESAAFRLGAPRPPLDATARQLDDAEAYIVVRLKKDAEIFSLISPSLQTYSEARTELANLQATVTNGVRVARFQLAAWRKAHQDLGNGVKNPARWLSAAYGVANRIV